MRPLVAWMVFVAIAASCGGAARHARELYAASTELSESVHDGDADEIASHIVVGQRQRIDYEALKQGADEWTEALGAPTSVRPEATVHLAPARIAEVVWTDDGWRFRTDPTVLYPQSTPREALTSLVRASLNERWDVMLRLAPRRYRLGLAEADLAVAWTEGEYAAALAESRDRLARHLEATVQRDAHQAILVYGDGRVARLEREGDRWVVVDF